MSLSATQLQGHCPKAQLDSFLLLKFHFAQLLEEQKGKSLADLDLYASCELRYFDNKAWHHKKPLETAVLACFKLPMGSLSRWPGRCWILISSLSLAKPLHNKCFL